VSLSGTSEGGERTLVHHTLGDSNYSVLIRVEMTSTGAVIKAEIADIARFHSDATYRAIALSARNAVLLSSPFALPGVLTATEWFSH
jgi:TPP-dependent 2-oxoacid decarboxylase